MKVFVNGRFLWDVDWRLNSHGGHDWSLWLNGVLDARAVNSFLPQGDITVAIFDKGKLLMTGQGRTYAWDNTMQVMGPVTWTAEIHLDKVKFVSE